VPWEWGGFRFSELIVFPQPLPASDHDLLLAKKHRFYFATIHGLAAQHEIERKRYAYLPLHKSAPPKRLYKAVPLEFAEQFWAGYIRLGTVEQYSKTEDTFAHDGYEGSFLTICHAADGSEAYCTSSSVGEHSLCFCSSVPGGRFGDHNYALFEIDNPALFIAALGNAVNTQCRPNFPVAEVHNRCIYRHTRIIRIPVDGSIRNFVESKPNLNNAIQQFGQSGGYDRYFVKHWSKRMEFEHRVLWYMASAVKPTTVHVRNLRSMVRRAR